MAKDTAEKKEAPNASATEPKKKVLKINIVWDGKEIKAGQGVPDGLTEWLKKAKKNPADYIVE
jgi:hypothetical protein